MTTTKPAHDVSPKVAKLLASADSNERIPDLAIARIDLIASTSNQSRFEPLDLPTVDRYVAALQEGDEFPPILVRLIPPKGKDPEQLIILSGNHRVRAHLQADRRTIDAYLVICDDLTALEIAYADNADHGLPTTENERIVHALVLIDQHGRTITDAAKTVGVSHNKIRVRINANETAARAQKAGVAPEFAILPGSLKASLSAVKNDKVLAKVITTIVTHRIGAGPAGAQRLISGVNGCSDTAGQMDFIAKFVKQLYADRPDSTLGRPPTNPYLVLLQSLSAIKGLNAIDVLDRCTNHRDRQELHDRLIAGARQLMAIDQVLQGEQKVPTA
jgi:ParB-like chromosome segregation protein Spo0J